jgi:hypothetical protein
MIVHSIVVFAQSNNHAVMYSDIESIPQKQWGNEINGISISIQTSKEKYFICENIILNIDLKKTLNIDKEIWYNRRDSLFSMDIEIVGSELSEVPLTMYGIRQKEFAYMLPSLTSFQFNKKNIISTTIGEPINKIFDMTLGGKYFIKVKRQFDISSNLDKTISNVYEITIENKLEATGLFPPTSKKLIKKQFGVEMSFLLDQEHYKEYCPIYLKLATKNIAKNSLSMSINATNFFDVYSLVLKMPGQNRDFRKSNGNGDVKEAKLTLYGQKLFLEKSKEPKPMVTVKPGEEVAETIIVLNRIFDMSEDGIYGLIVSRKFIDENSKEQTVTSDPLPIRVGTALTQDEIDQRIKERQEKEKNTKK